jgi:hypothetical protein
MKKLILLFSLIAICAFAFADTYIIGTGTSTGNYPFNGLYDYSWSKAIWTAAELTTAGIPADTPIIGIGFYVGNTPSNYTMLDQRIYVRTTTLTSYGTAADETGTGYPNPAGFLQLFQGDLTYNGGGWHYITFTTPATWDGTSNLELLFENRDSDYVTGYPTFRYTSTSPNYMMVYKYQDGSFPDAAGYRSYNRPNVAIITPSTTPPEAPVLSLPLDGATDVNEYTTFTWTAPQTGSLPTGYKLYCDTNNPPTTLIVDQSALSYTLTTPLAYNTTYYWTVSAYNAIGEGPQATVRSFTTREDPTIYTLPWLEDFGTTGTTFPPPNWFRGTGLLADPTIITSSTTYWVQDNWLNDTTVSPVNYAARMNIYGTNRSGWLITPPVQIPGTDYQLELDIGLTDYGNYAPIETSTDDRFIILIGDGSSWSTANIVREWNNTGSPYVYDNIPYTGQHVIISLDGYTGIKYIAFYGESIASGGDNDFFVDNVMVRETPAAPIFSYSPTSIDFGLLFQNVPSTPVNVTVTNIGVGILTFYRDDVTIVGPNAGMFTADKTNIPETGTLLAAGQSVIIPVTATVTQEGPVSATLIITYEGTPYEVALSAEGLPEGTVIIGTGTSTQRQPFGISWGYERSAALYTYAQIGGYGLLDKLAWNCSTSSTSAVPYKIYVKQTNDTALTAMTWSAFTASATLVDEGTHTFDTTGWYLFELDTPFPYYSGNLVIGVETNYGGSGISPYPYFYYSTGATASHQYWYADNNPPTGNGTINTNLPNLLLHLSELPEVPTISVSPSSWDFGQTLIRTTKTKDFTITNIGGGTLSVSSIDIEGDYYTLTTNPAPIDLASLESTTFTVEYAPLAAGHHSGTVTISANTGISTVELDGDCYDPTIYTLPYTESFEEGNTDGSTNIANWTQAVGPEFTSYYWTANSSLTTYNRAPRTGLFNVTLHYSGSAWLFRPVSLTGGTAYEFEAYARQDGSGSANATLGLYYGTEPTIASMTPITGQVGLVNGDYQRIYGVFAPVTTGIYYLGIKGWINATPWYISLDDVTICEAPPIPMFSYSPTSIDFGLLRQNVPSTPVNITVTNLGGGTLHLESSNISITGTNATMFAFDDENLPADLNAGQSVIIPVIATVTQEGPVSATLIITYEGTPYEVALSAEGLPEGIVVVGNGTANLYLPIRPYYSYSYSQSIFLQSELNIANKRIEKIWYYWNGAAEADVSNNWTIYMGHTDKTAFTSSSDWIPLANLTQVFSGEVPLPAVAGWIEIILDPPFAYNNTDNLVIAVDENEDDYDTSAEFFYCTNTTGINRSIRYNDDSTNPDPTAPPTGTQTAGYPNIKLQFGDMPANPPSLTIIYPENGATGLPSTGFNLTWGLLPASGPVAYYGVFLASSEESIYDEYYWETTSTHFNPVTEGSVEFEYNQRWYWTVLAHNEYGEDIIEPPYWFVIQADPRVPLPYTQDFGTDGTWPLNWTQTYSGGITSNRWSLSNTNTAGGTPYEMKATWASGTGVSRLISPPVNTAGVSAMTIRFRTYYDDYATGITAKLQYSHDLTTWYDTSWSIISGGGNVSGLMSVLITDLNSPTTYIAWTLDGNHFQFDYWYIDDVVFSVPPNHDVAPVSWDLPGQVVNENTLVTPKATVINNGVNTETFTVTCTIGDTYTNIQTVNNLGFGMSQQVTFAPLTPTLWTASLVTVTTNLSMDEVTENDTLYNVLICLPLDTDAVAENLFTDKFVQFNLATPGTMYNLTGLPQVSQFMAGADWANGKWLGCEYDNGTLATDNFWEINAMTGASTILGEMGAAIMGIAYDDNNNILYGTDGYDLYTMNVNTGVATYVDSLWYNLEGTSYSLANIGGLMIDIAYDNFTDTFYGIDLGNDCLWTINPTTRELTLIGFMGIDINYAQDAAFDQDNGLLFLAGYAGGGALYWIDTEYGGAYKVGNFPGNAEVAAFAIPYGLISVPEVTIASNGTISWAPVSGAIKYSIYKATDPYGTYSWYADAFGTSWTDPNFTTNAMAFYKVTAVGGMRNVYRQEMRYSNPIQHKGNLNIKHRYETGLANQSLMPTKSKPNK